ncbi:hypothetical protein J3459_009677 [Metarhizium acridum]|nr:hypothetical protein J3459_018353 [Metarhizium acridum]KAG8425845.1 hypothetical protein J3459_009677 [Metarhizium acridum]
MFRLLPRAATYRSMSALPPPKGALHPSVVALRHMLGYSDHSLNTPLPLKDANSLLDREIVFVEHVIDFYSAKRKPSSSLNSILPFKVENMFLSFTALKRI